MLEEWEKRLACEKCGKRFAKQWNFDKHLAKCGVAGAAPALSPADVQQPPPVVGREPSQGERMAGAFVRIADLLGISANLVDFETPDGHAILATSTGKAVVVSPDGKEIRPAEVKVE